MQLRLCPAPPRTCSCTCIAPDRTRAAHSTEMQNARSQRMRLRCGVYIFDVAVRMFFTSTAHLHSPQPTSTAPHHTAHLHSSRQSSMPASAAARSCRSRAQVQCALCPLNQLWLMDTQSSRFSTAEGQQLSSWPPSKNKRASRACSPVHPGFDCWLHTPLDVCSPPPLPRPPAHLCGTTQRAQKLPPPAPAPLSAGIAGPQPGLGTGLHSEENGAREATRHD